LAIYCLDNYFSGANDDEIVDFTHKGGWYMIDVLCKHSGFDIIFEDWEVARWVGYLAEVAEVLKVSTSSLLRREELTLASYLQESQPEAGKIIRKYAKKWLHITKEHFYDDDTADSESKRRVE
jgi:hypothetical protein